MAKNIFHASIEGAQHGAKTLEEFVVFAKNAGAAGAGAETQSAQQTAAYITAGALVVSMACVSQAGQKVRGWIDIYQYIGRWFDYL